MSCKLVVVAVLYLNSIIIVASDCTGPIRGSSEINQPLIMSKSSDGNFAFVLPQAQRFVVFENETVMLACPNAGNYLQNSDTKLSEALCRKKRFKIGNRTFGDINELQCKKPIRAEIKPTNETCGNKEGSLINIGYYINSEKFASLIKICYDTDKDISLYAGHTIQGKSLKHKTQTQIKSSFSTDGLAPNSKNLSIVYNRAYQKAIFKDTFGSASMASFYINSESYLSLTRLVPFADFYYAAWQHGTFFYINTAPMWNEIRQENWQKIESMVRTAASDAGAPFQIYTGTYGVLKLQDDETKKLPLYLMPNDMLPIPAYFWKIVYFDKQAVVIIIINNPYNSIIDPEDYFCKCICQETQWWRNTWEMPRRGLVHCCDYDEFAKTARKIPALDVRGIFIKPSAAASDVQVVMEESQYTSTTATIVGGQWPRSGYRGH